MAPVIGITAYAETARWGPWEQPYTLVPENYVTSMQAAGAHVVVLPAEPDPTEVVARLDGLIVAGGADLDAALYGAEPHATNDVPRSARDAHELAAYRAARERGLPVLGICRGLQVMAVAHGGSLVQHLPDHVGADTHRPAPGLFSTHGATFAADSLVSRVLGTTATTVNSSHHQAVADAGSLTVTGWAEDGTVEACEDPSAPFVLGVQWHPEALDDPSLFRALAAAAG